MPTTTQAGTEADARGEGEILRKLWKHDVEDCIAFAKDQADNGKINFNSDNSIKSVIFFSVIGNRGNRWSSITYRIGNYSTSN